MCATKSDEYASGPVLWKQQYLLRKDLWKKGIALFIQGKFIEYVFSYVPENAECVVEIWISRGVDCLIEEGKVLNNYQDIAEFISQTEFIHKTLKSDLITAQ